MSNWMIEGNTLKLWNEQGMELHISRLADTGGLAIEIEWYEEVSKFQEEVRTTPKFYIHGRNLEVLREFFSLPNVK